jgi:hypothetical protein
MKRIHFYATRNDILDVTRNIELKHKLKYILTFHTLFPQFSNIAPEYNCASDIPKIGIASRKSSNGCEKYLVAETAAELIPSTELIGGKLITAYRPGSCAQCITFNAGGFWQEEVLLNGLIETWSSDSAAQRLMRQFQVAIKKGFKEKIGEFWVGPEAFEFLRNGGRLTINVSAAPKFDLVLPS